MVIRKNSGITECFEQEVSTSCKTSYIVPTFYGDTQGRSQDFSRGRGGLSMCQSEGTHQIVMSTSTPYFSFM